MRYQDWPQRLHKRIMAVHATPFEWGKHDCCLFASDTVLELTGTDHAADLRGTYSSALEAAKVLKERGGVRGIAGAALGAEIPATLAQRGDIVLIQTEDHGDTLAVCIGMQCVAPGLDKLLYLPMTAAVTAWRV
ncbi:MAG: hypothetical protein ABSA86_13140 [Oryzomonas sp.]|jgi:hypothetical protein